MDTVNQIINMIQNSPEAAYTKINNELIKLEYELNTLMQTINQQKNGSPIEPEVNNILANLAQGINQDKEISDLHSKSINELQNLLSNPDILKLVQESML